MLRKILSLTLACLLAQFALARTAAAAGEREARFAEKVKAGIARLGTGADARVEVKLRDKRKLRGYVGEAGAEGFTVVDDKTGAATTVAYPQVKTVKGNNLSEGARIAIVAGIVVGALLLTVYFVSQTK